MEREWSEPPVTFESPAREEFVSLAAGPFRKELLAPCYRMLASLQDAEDLVQDTFVRAWRAFDQFDPERGSLKNWLYRIATNACFSALRDRGRRALPSELVPRAEHPASYPTTKYPETTWLQPIPDALLGSEPADPATVAILRESIRLAFIAALQHLPPRQRASLILKDVLAWRSNEVADLLETTPTAINSALQRARTQLSQIAPVQEEVAEPTEAEQLDLLNRYVSAFQSQDLTALAAMLRDDAVLEMPPWLHWVAGRNDVMAFIRMSFGRRPTGAWRMRVTAANRQPALASYARDDTGTFRAHSIHVFTIAAGGIRHIVAFVDDALFPAFGLPTLLES